MTILIGHNSGSVRGVVHALTGVTEPASYGGVVARGICGSRIMFCGDDLAEVGDLEVAGLVTCSRCLTALKRITAEGLTGTVKIGTVNT